MGTSAQMPQENRKGINLIELHGWVTFRDTYKATWEEDMFTSNLVGEIQEHINKLYWFKPEIKVRNGEWYMDFSIFANRKDSETKEALALFQKIGEIAEGSYGLIYLYDDEDITGKENQFQVFVLARGIVTEVHDTLLSPIIPTIEDADELKFEV